MARHPQAATSSTTPATRPGGGNGASAAAAPTTSAHHAHDERPATPQVAHDQPAGTPITGQVASISHATPCITLVPGPGSISTSAVDASTAGTITIVYSGIATRFTPAETIETLPKLPTSTGTSPAVTAICTCA